MLNINSDAKLKDLLEFPCQFTYKVMGYAKPELPELVLEVIQRHAPATTALPLSLVEKGHTTPSLLPSQRLLSSK